LGLVVQILAISVDHQRYYFERSFAPFFWLDERHMYTDSPLFARPAELAAVARRADVASAPERVPGPRPESMTGYVYGPTVAELPHASRWMRRYLVFLVPRPWVLWSRYLPTNQQPVPSTLLTWIGSGILFSSLCGLVLLARRRA